MADAGAGGEARIAPALRELLVDVAGIVPRTRPFAIAPTSPDSEPE